MASKCSFLSWALLSFLLVFPLVIESRPLSSPPSHLPKDYLFKKLEGCRKGQTVEGLNRLKQYLEKFGYLPHHSMSNEENNEGDLFNDSLESAIKTYQLNYHLNVSGALDADTVKQMARPRCGMPDVVDGKNTMRSGRERHLGATGFHVVEHYSFFEGNPTPSWPSSKTHLTYGFLNSGRIDVQTLRSVCSSAFSKWASASQFTFEETQNVDSADIKIGFFSGDHGDGFPFDGEFKTLAHAFAPTDGRLHFDGDENWGTDISPNSMDVESVAVHEIGHLLGLHHSEDDNAIMFPSIAFGVKKVDLGQDDIDGIRALYNLS